MLINKNCVKIFIYVEKNVAKFVFKFQILELKIKCFMKQGCKN